LSSRAIAGIFLFILVSAAVIYYRCCKSHARAPHNIFSHLQLYFLRTPKENGIGILTIGSQRQIDLSVICIKKERDAGNPPNDHSLNQTHAEAPDETMDYEEN
ncbi:hypothetical protein F2P79_013831, partial [Pimephales promelas]